MYRIHVGGCDEPFGDTALIADDDNAEVGLVELGNCVGHVREEQHLAPTGHVLPFGRFPVNYAVTIQKRGFVHEILSAPQALKWRARSGCGTPECAGSRSMAHRYSGPQRP